MKLTSYTPTVAKSNIQTHVANAGDIKSYAANTTGVDALNKSLGGVNALVVKAIEDKDITNIANANTEYSKRIDDLLYNNENGLILKQELGADGITDNFEKEEKKIREEVLGKFHFTFGKSRQGLIGNMNNIAASRYNLTAKHETTQLEKGKDTALANNINIQILSAEQNYGDNTILKQCADNIMQVVAARYIGQDPAYIQKMQNAALTKLYTSQYSVAENSGDTTRALDILNDHAELFPEQQRAALIGKNIAIQESDFTLNFLNDLPNKFDLLTPEGIEKAKEYTKNYFEYQAGGTGSGVSIDKVIAFYNKTAGTPYVLGGAEDGSGGSFDCGSWTKACMAATGVKLDSREADRQYIQLKNQGKSFTDETQLKPGDMVFWHTSNRWGYTDNENEPGKAYKGITHVGIYAGDGQVMQAGSSRGVSKTDLHSMEVVAFAHTGGAGQVRRKPTASEYEKINASIDAKAQQLLRQKKAADTFVYDSIFNQIIAGDEPKSQAEIDSIIARTAKTPEQLNYARYKYRAASATSRGGSGGGTGGSGSDGGAYGLTAEVEYGIKDQILNNRIENSGELFELTQGMKESDRKRFYNFWKKSTESGGLLSKQIDAANNALGWDNSTDSQMAKVTNRQLLIDYVISKGGNVTNNELLEMAKLTATRPKVDSGSMFIRDTETTSTTEDINSGKLKPVPNKPGNYEWYTKYGKKYGPIESYQHDKVTNNLE